MMVEVKQDGDGKKAADSAAPLASLAESSARMFAGQTAIMTAMTFYGINLASQMTGIFLNNLKKVEDRSAETTGELVALKVDVPAEKKDNVVPLRATAKKSRLPEKDDLKRISGIGPRLEKVLNQRGIARFADILALNEAQLAVIDEQLGLEGRVMRDDWVSQAKKLAKIKG